MNSKLSDFLKYKNLPITLICCWFVFLLINAVLTPLHVDECYYWLYGKNLDWGYFDHPPGVAVLIYLSDMFLNGTLGVRFFSILAHLLSYYFIYELIDAKKNNRFFIGFFLFTITLPLNHLYGFITTPDVPLILSCTIYLLLYKRVLKTDKTWLFLLWGLSMALMLYSKYHGVLVIFFTLISNPKIFLNPKLYLAGALGIIMLIPHFIWQYNHDFASFVYHLQERLVIYKWTYPLEYWLNLILIINPLFIGFFYSVIKKFPKNQFERTLYFNLIGFIIFFAYQSFKVQVQPQWLIIIYIPFVILFFNRFQEKKLKFIKKSFLIIFPFLLVLHLFMIVDLLPHDLDIHRKKDFVEMIQSDADGKPVMFLGSYGRASSYAWYSDQAIVHTHNGPRNRKNQFNIWKMDSIFFEKEIYMVGEYGHGKRHKKYDGNFYGVPRTYYPTDKIKLLPIETSCNNDTITTIIEINNQYDFDLDLQKTYSFRTFYFNKGRTVSGFTAHDQIELKVSANSKDTISLSWELPDKEFDVFGTSIAHVNGLFGPIYRRDKTLCK